jgi:transcriptional regulator with XRE-family HTH domain
MEDDADKGRTVDPIGPVVKAYRKGLGLKQVEFGAQLGLDQGTISRLERRPARKPLDDQAVETIRAVAQHMGRAPDYFIEYRTWRTQELVARYPGLVDKVYDLLVDQASVYDEAGQRQADKSRNSGK